MHVRVVQVASLRLPSSNGRTAPQFDSESKRAGWPAKPFQRERYPTESPFASVVDGIARPPPKRKNQARLLAGAPMLFYLVVRKQIDLV